VQPARASRDRLAGRAQQHPVAGGREGDEPVRVVGVYSGPHSALRIGLGLRYHMVLIAVECRVTGGTLSRSDETLDEGWFDPDDLPPLVPSHYQRIADAHMGGKTLLR